MFHGAQIHVGIQHIVTTQNLYSFFGIHLSSSSGSIRLAASLFVLPLYGVAFTLIRWGYQPVVLGARTPPSAIRHAVESIQPKLVGLSVTVAPPAYRARELINGYAEAVQSVPWIVGGPGSDQLQPMVEESGGIVVGTRPLEEVRLLLTGAAGSGAARSGTAGRARKG